MAADPRFRPGSRILLDHTALDATQLTDADLREIGASVAAIRERLGASHVALIVPDPVTFALADQSLSYAAPLELRSRIFYSRADAVAWLVEETQGS